MLLFWQRFLLIYQFTNMKPKWLKNRPKWKNSIWLYIRAIRFRKGNPIQTQAILQNFEDKTLIGGLQVAEELTHTLMAQILKDTESAYHFEGF